jgi:hypothetical protein
MLPVLLQVQQLQGAAIRQPTACSVPFSMKCAIPLAFLQSCKYNENHYHCSFQRDTGYPLPLVTPFSSGLLASQPRPRQASHIFIQKAARYSGELHII